MDPSDSIGRTLLSLWYLMRPKGLFCVLLLPMIGYGWGHWDYALPAQAPELLIRLLCAWACFHCASMWMNADLDQDESEVIFGHPAPIPGSVRHFSFSASILGIAVCGSISWVLMGIGICTAVLGWMYSSKSICWKSHPVAGPLVNGVGYGVLSPLAGWWIVDVPMTARTVMTGATLVMGVMGTYFVSRDTNMRWIKNVGTVHLWLYMAHRRCCDSDVFVLRVSSCMSSY